LASQKFAIEIKDPTKTFENPIFILSYLLQKQVQLSKRQSYKIYEEKLNSYRHGFFIDFKMHQTI